MSGKPNLVLADYFDYVAGTSTGAIIATLVTLGKSTEQIRDFTLRAAQKCLRRRGSGIACEHDRAMALLLGGPARASPVRAPVNYSCFQ